MNIKSYLKYRSNRREIFINSLTQIYNIEPSLKDKILQIVELIHFTATTIDDILDRDEIRKEIPTYYMRNGIDKAILDSFRTLNKALAETVELNIDIYPLLAFIEKMINSQEADLGLILRDETYEPIDWYFEFPNCKLSLELQLIHYIIYSSSKMKRNDSINNVLSKIGKIIQCYDDLKDTDVSEIKTNDKNVRINYNYLIAISSELISPTYESMVGKVLDQNKAIDFYQELRKEIVIKYALKEISKIKIEIIKDLNAVDSDDFSSEITSLMRKIENLEYFKNLEHETI